MGEGETDEARADTCSSAERLETLGRKALSASAETSRDFYQPNGALFMDWVHEIVAGDK